MHLIEMGLDGEITIPRDIVEKLNIRDHVHISLSEDSIVIQPLQEGFSPESLQE